MTRNNSLEPEARDESDSGHGGMHGHESLSSIEARDGTPSARQDIADPPSFLQSRPHSFRPTKPERNAPARNQITPVQVVHLPAVFQVRVQARDGIGP